MNRVILLGGDHHNLLGLARDFGVNGVAPTGIIVCAESDYLFSNKSKYWEKVWCVDTEEAAIELIKATFSDEAKPAVIIASSDAAAAALDAHYEELENHFILPGFQVGGRILELMNKEKQVSYANEIGVEMLTSETMLLNGYEYSKKYPVILKPVASVEGKKTDIKICNNVQEEEDSVQELMNAGYPHVLRQLYLKTREEYVLTGAVMPVLHKCNFTLVKHTRQWPVCFGTGSFSEFVTDKRMLAFCEQVMDKVQKSGYCGLIDIEFFGTPDGKVYLNEFNWRSSGRNFVSLYTDVHSAYWWYCAVTGIKYDDSQRISTKSGWTMNEITDFRHIFKRKISVAEWLRDVQKTDSFAVWDRRDPAPFRSRIFGLIKKLRKKGV